MTNAPSPAHSPDDDMMEPDVALSGEALMAMRDRPGFLIRRLHQIHVALFAEECAGENVTPVQYSVLTALQRAGPAEQTALGAAVGLDRTNMADVLDRLQKRGLIARTVSARDKRRKVVGLTEAGRDVLARIEIPVERAHERTIEALPVEDRRRFVDFLLALVEAKNEVGRAPLRLS